MRSVALCLSCFALLACGSDDTPSDDAASIRERLATETHLFMAASDSAGAITAQLKTAGGWRDGLIDLQLDSGEMVARTTSSDTLALGALELGLQTIAIPASLVGHDAALTRPRLRLIAPAEISMTWIDDNSAVASATLDLELSWSLTVDGVAFSLGTPALPALPVTLELSGSGRRITAEIRVHASGELWSWAGLVKLSDLELVLGARTP
jgi:hypothetical protein